MVPAPVVHSRSATDTGIAEENADRSSALSGATLTSRAWFKAWSPTARIRRGFGMVVSSPARSDDDTVVAAPAFGARMQRHVARRGLALLVELRDAAEGAGLPRNRVHAGLQRLAEQVHVVLGQVGTR